MTFDTVHPQNALQQKADTHCTKEDEWQKEDKVSYKIEQSKREVMPPGTVSPSSTFFGSTQAWTAIS